ncbi:MAG: polysaccharide deacetylase family protein [Bacteroidales bacterium]|nr:polysaccharide deacetylase family protein [Bacteroidales bacterium]
MNYDKNNIMLLIFIEKITNRVGYTLNLIFKDILGVQYNITTNKEAFANYKGPKLSYSKRRIDMEPFIFSKELLFETIIEIQDLDFFYYKDTPSIFKTFTKDTILPFDIFAATFYFVSRYEEYLPFIQDKHGRFRYEESFAYKNSFLHKPVVNIWAKLLKEKLQKIYPELIFKKHYFRYYNTIDVDSAYSIKEKGIFRIVYGLFRDFFQGNFSECLYRLKVIFFNRRDPFDTFDYQISLIKKFKLKTIYFILFGRFGKFDKNISPYNKKFHRLIKYLCDYAKVGIHPSYDSFEQDEELGIQIKELFQVIQKPVFRSRFHYLKFRLPISFRKLIDNMITDDYSMGYSDMIGFRAGICSGYNFFDLEIDGETKLRFHPFAIMDVALKTSMQLEPYEAIEKIKQIVDQVIAVEGDFISVWHNESLCERYQWKGWRVVYEKMIEYVSAVDRTPFEKEFGT